MFPEKFVFIKALDLWWRLIHIVREEPYKIQYDSIISVLKEDLYGARWRIEMGEAAYNEDFCLRFKHVAMDAEFS